MQISDRGPRAPDSRGKSDSHMQLCGITTLHYCCTDTCRTVRLDWPLRRAMQAQSRPIPCALIILNHHYDFHVNPIRRLFQRPGTRTCS